MGTKPYFHLIIYLLVLVLFQCQPKEKEGEANVTPSFILDDTSILKFDECVDEVEFIPLIAPKDTLINLSCNVFELVVNDKIYYASRCYKDLSIHSFDLEGNHLKSWNRKGDGPQEYPSLHGLVVEGNDIYINSGRGAIYNYSLPDFDFKQQIELGDYNFVPTISRLQAENWLISSEPSGNDRNRVFHEVDAASKISKTLPVFTLPYSGELNPGMITKIKEGHLLNFGLTDTIYQYQHDSVNAFITLNFGNKSIPSIDFELEGEEFMEKILLSQNYAFNTGQIDYSGGVLKLMVYGIEKNLDFTQEDLSTFPFYDVFIKRETGKQIIAKALLSVRNNSYSKDGYFYQILQQEDWQRALDREYFGRFEKELLKALEKLSDQEDPIILKFKVAF